MAGRNGFKRIRRMEGEISLGMALLVTGEEALEEEAFLAKNDVALRNQRLAEVDPGRKMPTVDLGVVGSLDPEKLLLLKEFLRERRRVQGDSIVTGDNADGLSGLLLSVTDIAELRQIMRA